MGNSKAEEIPGVGKAQGKEITKGEEIPGVGKAQGKEITKGEKRGKRDLSLTEAILEVNHTAQRASVRVTEVEKAIEAIKADLGGEYSKVKRDLAYAEGAKRIIVLAENKLAEELGLLNREALSQHGDLIPSWWLATIFSI